MRLNLLLCVCVFASTGLICQAAIIGVDCRAQGEDVEVRGWNWDDSAYSLTINETLTGTDGGILAGFTTDTDPDPIVWIRKSVENDTSFMWSSYHITLLLDRPFEILDTSTPAGWACNVTDPVLQGDRYAGAVDYYLVEPGTGIEVGQAGDFGLKVWFEGSVQFCVQQVPVPEPVSLAMLLAAGAYLLRRRTGMRVC